jgi:hypothetical protein
MFAVVMRYFVEGLIAPLGQDNGIGCPDCIKILCSRLSTGAE